MRHSFLRLRLICTHALFGLGATALLASAWPAHAQLTATRDEFVFQDQVGGAIEQGDAFGATLATGDFDGDGALDLAIGAPDEDITDIGNAGAVFVTYGDPSGLGAGPRAPLVLHQDVTGVDGVAEAADGFGSALATGDFDGDGYDDLAVATPYEDIQESSILFHIDAGVVHVFYGSAGGLQTDDQLLDGESFVPSWGYATGDELGRALAAGDTRGFPPDDLLIGVPGGSLAPAEFEGVVIEVGGASGSGLDPVDHAVFVPPGRDDGDRFGAALAAGDLDGGGQPDQIMSAPFADPDATPTDAGAVWISLPSGFTRFEGAVAGDLFGSSVAAGDFTGQGHDRMIVTLPGRDTDGVSEAGLAFVYDLVATSIAGVWQGFDGYHETPEPFDHFAEALATGDFDGDGFDDAAFGVPGENLFDADPDPVLDAGVVQVAYGSATGLTSVGNQLWSLEAPDVGFNALDNDHYGAALAAGDFDGDGADDLAVGLPDATWDGQSGTGFVHVLYGEGASIFADGFESGDTSMWSATAE